MGSSTRTRTTITTRTDSPVPRRRSKKKKAGISAGALVLIAIALFHRAEDGKPESAAASGDYPPRRARALKQRFAFSPRIHAKAFCREVRHEFWYETRFSNQRPARNGRALKQFPEAC